MQRSLTPWIVLKFGGTSVSTLANWRNIAQVTAARRAEGAQVLIVHSALTGITDRLEKLLDAALDGTHEGLLAEIERRHQMLGAELNVGVGPELARHLAELKQMVSGIALVGEVSDRTRARVMATGELMATALGGAYLNSQGLPAAWADARKMLSAEDRGASAKASVLSATCGFAPDPELSARLAELGPIVITQGFIASDESGATVLLGRGGSDTSAAYLAAKLSAKRLEIWTDVPGMFSANPRSTPTARLLRSLHYDEAQEIASNGAKVLHPRCILPARQYRIPLHVHATQTPDLEGTVVTAEGSDGAGQVKAVCIKKGITLIAMDSPGMWHQVGFLADAFQVFKDHGMSVDLVSTSETSVTVSLDPAANSLDSKQLAAFVEDLGRLCRVQVIGPCASVSLVGRNIRGILHHLGDAFEFFAEQKVYLVSQAANDLNFTFVVDENQGDRLVEQLHELLVRPVPGDRVLGPTWEQLFAQPGAPEDRAPPWWLRKRSDLLDLLGERTSAYVYDAASIKAAAATLRGMKSVARVLYAMKANSHPEVIRLLDAAGLDFECVSAGEVRRVLEACPRIERGRIHFTPNFAPRDEYSWAFEQGICVTIDNVYVIEAWQALLRGRDIFLRVDPGIGRGHHQHVRTAGARSKFGIPVTEMDSVSRQARAMGTRIVGLHAHSGSGVFDITNWTSNATLLADLAQSFPDVQVIDIGGGFGVPESADQREIDFKELDVALQSIRATYPKLSIWIEPGRYLVAAAGALIARVTQLKSKAGMRYVGIATGMNSLLRPALYGAHHEIVNLSRLDEPADQLVNIVGPICETGDILGHDRLLPAGTRAGDVLLIANTGAYGRAMSSSYNLREPAEELIV